MFLKFYFEKNTITETPHNMVTVILSNGVMFANSNPAVGVFYRSGKYQVSSL